MLTAWNYAFWYEKTKTKDKKKKKKAWKTTPTYTLGRSRIARVAVRMVLQRSFSVRLLDFIGRSVGLHTEQIVKLGLLHHFLFAVRFTSQNSV
jgi:hypothetical protein